MFGTLRVKNRFVTVFSLFCLLIFVTVCLLTFRLGAPDTVEIGGERYALRVEDDADITAFCDKCGCEVSELFSKREITVPKHWSDSYTVYNELQREQGFDLLPYKGKPAVEYVYTLADSETLAYLLVSDGRIIGGHLCDVDGGNLRTMVTS